MAFVSDGSPDQNQAQQPGQNPLSQQAPVTSAPNAGGTGGSAKPSNSAPAQPFTNLSSYLTANAPQIQSEANTIAGNLTNSYNATTGAIDQAGKSFQNDVNSGYTPMNQDVLNGVQSNPTAVANDPTQAKEFSGMYGDSYTGPSTFQDSSYYAPLSSQVQSGQTAASEVGTVPGLQSYLSQGNPNYTQGQSTLDSVLLNGNPDAVSTVTAAAQPFTNLPGYLQSAVTAGNTAAQTGQTNAQAAKTAAQAAMGTAVTGLNTGVQGEMTAAQKAAQDYNASVQQQQQEVADTTNLLNQFPQLLAQYGASVNGTPYPVAPTSFAPRNITPLSMTPANVASSHDYATAAALEALSGNGVSLPIDQSTVSQAGTYSTPATPGIDDLNGAITAAQQWAAQANPTINVGSSGNLQPFATAANNWYSQLIAELNAVNNTPPSGFNTGPKGGPFTAGPGGGLGGPGTPGGV